VGKDGVMFTCAHVYDVALCGNTVRNVALDPDWLATPGIYSMQSRLIIVTVNTIVKWFYEKKLKIVVHLHHCSFWFSYIL